MKKTIVNLALVSVLAIGFTGCGNEERKSFYDDGKPKTIGFYDGDGKRQDTFKMFAADGSLLEETTYKDNKIVSGYVIKNTTETIDEVRYETSTKTTYTNGNINSSEKKVKGYDKNNELITDLVYDTNGNIVSGFETVTKKNTVDFNPQFAYGKYGVQPISTTEIVKNKYLNGQIIKTDSIKVGDEKLIKKETQNIFKKLFKGGEKNFCKVFKNTEFIQEVYGNMMVQTSKSRMNEETFQQLLNEYACLLKEKEYPKIREQLGDKIGEIYYNSYYRISSSINFDEFLTFLSDEQIFSIIDKNKSFYRNYLKEDYKYEDSRINKLNKELIIKLAIKMDDEYILNNIEPSKYTEEDMKKLVKFQVSTLELFPTHSLELQKFASNLNFRSLAHIKNLDQTIAFDTLKKNIEAIRYIKQPTLEMIEYIVATDPRYLSSINNIPEDIQIKLIQKDLKNLNYIQKPSENIWNNFKKEYFSGKKTDFNLHNYIYRKNDLINSLTFHEAILATLQNNSFVKLLSQKSNNPKVKEFIKKYQNDRGRYIMTNKIDMDQFLVDFKEYEDFIFNRLPYLYTLANNLSIDKQKEILEKISNGFTILAKTKNIDPSLKPIIIQKYKENLSNSNIYLFNYKNFPEITKMYLFLKPNEYKAKETFKKHPELLYIKNNKKNFCFRYDGYFFDPNKSLDLCDFSLKKVKKLTPEIIKEHISKNGLNIEDDRIKPEDKKKYARLAFKTYSKAYLYLENKTEEDLLELIKRKDFRVYKWYAIDYFEQANAAQIYSEFKVPFIKPSEKVKKALAKAQMEFASKILDEEILAFKKINYVTYLGKEVTDKYEPLFDKEMKKISISMEDFKKTFDMKKLSENDQKILNELISSDFSYDSSKKIKDIETRDETVWKLLFSKDSHESFKAYGNDLSDDLKTLVVFKGATLNKILNPSDRLIKLALNTNDFLEGNLKGIEENASDELKLMFIEREPSLIRFIKNPSDRLIKRAIELEPLVKLLFPKN